MSRGRIGGLEETAAVARHLVRMRVTWAVFLATVPLAAVAGFSLPRLDPAAATPTSLTLVVLAAVLWISFTAERDARKRLERAKRAFAAHGELVRLLRDHWFVFVLVLIRLDVIVGLGVVTAVWGAGPRVGLWFEILAGLLMVLAVPTEHKARMVVATARDFDAED
jgi:hypothetical protein